MPKLNTRGDVLMGAGGTQGSWNGVPFPFASYGRGAFMDDDTVIVAVRAFSAQLAFWTPGTPAPAVIDPPRTANAVAGGGGKWIALGSHGHDTLLYGSVGDRLGAGFGDVAADGTIAFKPVYQSDRGLVIIAPDGRGTLLPSVAPIDVQALPGGGAIWLGGAFARPPVRPFYANARSLKLATVGDEDWLLYWADGVGLVLQVDGEAEGYVLETRPVFFAFDMIGGAFLTIVWAWTEAEAPRDLVKLHARRGDLQFIVDPDGQARPLPVWRTFALAVPVPTPTPHPAPLPIPVPVPPTPEPKPMPQTPSLDAWINIELPQLIAAFRGNSSNAAAMADDPHAPHAEWGAFQTYRRYVEARSFGEMLHHEQTQGTTPEPP